MNLYAQGWCDCTLKYPPMSTDREYLRGWDEGIRYRMHKALAALVAMIERNS